MEDKKEKGFVVKDRRYLDEAGDLRAEGEIGGGESTAPAEEKQQEEKPHRSATEDLPEINFASFIFSLSTTAMYHFGDFVDPELGTAEKNLPAAKQTIDILGILKDKTAGNLDEHEENLLDGLLYDLRMRYIKEKTGT